MTRDEITKLLAMMVAAYPATKISDPAAMVGAWEMSFGEEDAAKVFKAARVHLDKSPYFPTVSDIRKNLRLGGLVYGEEQGRQKVTSGTSPRIEGTSCAKRDCADFCVMADLGYCDARENSECLYGI